MADEQPPFKRYLVVRDIPPARDDVDADVYTLRAGDEHDMTPELVADILERCPGALMEMDPKTKTDWEAS